jgi:ribosomal protein S18 acetylase RimI-like enzyme
MRTSLSEITCIPVQTAEQIQIVADLAGPIWREQFTPIIGPEQVEFMLDDWQSPRAINAQIQTGTHYYLVTSNPNHPPIGYLAWKPDPGTYPPCAKVSKFYLGHAFHGQGYATQMMDFIEKQVQKEGIMLLWLQVNRHNHRAIHFYQKVGFVVTRDQRKEIGPGFFIDDHIMEKAVAPASR